MKPLSRELQLFVLDFQSKLAVKPDLGTVATFKPNAHQDQNHEKWRTCNRCGNEVDLRKELDDNCAICGGKLK